MRKFKIRFRKFIIGWFIPERIRRIIVRLLDISHKDLKRWCYQHLSGNIHASDILDADAKSRLWLSLQAEVRVGVIIRKNTVFSLKETNGDWIQFGVGTPREDWPDIKIFLDGQQKANLPSMEEDCWHNLRMPIKGAKELKIEMAGTREVFVSDPVVSYNENKNPKNIICIVLDCLAPEMITPEHTPYINRFFESGITCHQVYSQADWTLPAFSSMLTGLYPSRHATVFNSVLDEKILTLPELLKRAGYRTFGYASHLRFSPAYGHAKGFERFVSRPMFLGRGNNHAKGIHETIQHLEAHKDESNFIFMHIFDTHRPFKHPSYLMDRLKNNLDDQYAKLKEVDLSLQALFSYIEEQPWAKEVTVICTADHGKLMKQKDKRLLLDRAVSIPLKVRGPHIQAGSSEDFIEGSVDLLPSLLHIANVEDVPVIDGRVWPFLGGDKREDLFSESIYLSGYEACFRNENFSYHFKCGYNEDKQKIDLQREEPIVVFKRSAGREIEEDQDISEEERERIRLKFLDKIRGHLFE